jgi:hypothetical protein
MVSLIVDKKNQLVSELKYQLDALFVQEKME